MRVSSDPKAPLAKAPEASADHPPLEPEPKPLANGLPNGYFADAANVPVVVAEVALDADPDTRPLGPLSLASDVEATQEADADVVKGMPLCIPTGCV